MVRTPVQAHPRSAVSLPAKWEDKLTRTALYPCQRNGRNICSSAPAQHCIRASEIVGTPVQVHPDSTVSWQPNGKNTRASAPGQHCIHASQISIAPAALHPCQPDGKNTRSSAPAQHCIQASQIVETRVQVHPRSTVSM